VERDVDVVSEEDCTDRKMDEVYRPTVVTIKTEYEVSIVTLLSDVFVVPVYVCVYVVPCLFGEAAVFSLHWCTGEMSTC
jgi:hypothetical protein